MTSWLRAMLVVLLLHPACGTAGAGKMDWTPHSHRFQGHEIAFSLPADFVPTEHWKDPLEWRTTLALTEQKRRLFSMSVSPLRVRVAVVAAPAEGDVDGGDVLARAGPVLDLYDGGRKMQVWQPDGVVPLEREIDTFEAAGTTWVRVVYHRAGHPEDVFSERFLRLLEADTWIAVSGVYRRSQSGDDAELDEGRARVQRIVESLTVGAA